MAKRFTDTNKYKKPFIRSLQGPYKVLWDYLYHECDHAGIWIVDFEIAQIYIGSDLPVNYLDALKFFNSDEKRIIEIDDCKKWFIPSFIDFQYGELNPQNRAHNSVISILKRYNLYEENKGLIRPLNGAKDKDKDKDKDKEMDKRKESFKKSVFEFSENYKESMLNDFFEYWTEHGENDKKMRFEKEKTFGISRRLATWKKNESRFGGNKNPEEYEFDNSRFKNS